MPDAVVPLAKTLLTPAKGWNTPMAGEPKNVLPSEKEMPTVPEPLMNNPLKGGSYTVESLGVTATAPPETGPKLLVVWRRGFVAMIVSLYPTKSQCKWNTRPDDCTDRCTLGRSHPAGGIHGRDEAVERRATRDGRPDEEA